MVFTTAMDTWNGFHYCYGDKEWFSLLLWRQGMVFTTATETINSFHYCHGDEEWFSLLLSPCAQRSSSPAARHRELCEYRKSDNRSNSANGPPSVQSRISNDDCRSHLANGP